METIGKKLELGIFRTSKPIEEEPKCEKTENKQPESSRNGSQSPTKKKQTVFLKKKKEKECQAEAKIEKKMTAREAVSKTFSVPAETPRIVREKATLTVSVTDRQLDQKQKASNSQSASGVQSEPSVAQVEQKLNDIAKEAEDIVKELKNKKESEERKVQENQREKSSSSDLISTFDNCTVVEETLHDILTVEVAPPSIKAAETLSCSSPPVSPKKLEKEKKVPPPTAPKPYKRTTSRTVDAEGSQTTSVEKQNEQLQSLKEATDTLLDLASLDSFEMEKSQSHSDIRILKANKIPACMTTSEIRISNSKQRESLADRLSKGLHDLTHGSSDRLQKWKTKLQSTGRRSKDGSEPPPMTRPMLSSTVPATDVLVDWTPSKGAPRPLHCTKSAQNATEPNSSSEMDHRTLKFRDGIGSQKDLTFHYNHMNSLQKIMNTFDGYSKCSYGDLPPPVRMMPKSGVKPQCSDILRPVAFRPIGNQNLPEDKQRQSHQNIRVDKQVIRGDITKSASNLVSLCSSTTSSHSSRMNRFPAGTSFSPKQENEYDTVSEYIEKEKINDFCSVGSDYGCFPSSNKLSSSTVSSGTGSSHMSSPPTTNKKSYPSLGSNGRSSSGIHITPSPSDSGIVDFESVIRDKENELREVRNTMEHNEEIIVKVYLEKERAWMAEIEHLKSRLTASERGENALRAQLQGCQRQTDTLQRTMEGLRDEKTGLLRKCFQIERELTQLKVEMDKPRPCDQCKKQKPIPAPRQIKDSELNLRSEVSSLRDEVHTLRNALNDQISLFKDERRKNQSDISRCSDAPSHSEVSIGKDRLI